MSSSDEIVIVHAGVGGRSERSVKAICELCEKAARRGRQMGHSTRDSTAAVVEAIRTLEESPLTNAGTGSNVNRECAVECDASIVEGHSQRGGSVGAVPSVPHAILIAHKMLMQRGSPACLYGPGALSWFRENGGEMPEQDVVTKYQRKMFTKYTAKKDTLPTGDTYTECSSSAATTTASSEVPEDFNEGTSGDEMRLDTVGAVAFVGGRISAGVSSGGTFLKSPGRVGQAGVYGAGCWADRFVGISTSGTGEHLIRTALASRCVAALNKTRGGKEDEEDDEPPPAMKLKTFLEESFVQAPCVRDGGVQGMAAGVIGVVYDDEFHTCDLVWAHTSANFILGYATPRSPKGTSHVCPQQDIQDIEKIKVYASGTTVRLAQK